MLAGNMDPVDPLEASYTELIRVPGIGPKGARKIIMLRKNIKVKKLVPAKAKPYLKIDGRVQSKLEN